MDLTPDILASSSPMLIPVLESAILETSLKTTNNRGNAPLRVPYNPALQPDLAADRTVTLPSSVPVAVTALSQQEGTQSPHREYIWSTRLWWPGGTAFLGPREQLLNKIAPSKPRDIAELHKSQK